MDKFVQNASRMY